MELASQIADDPDGPVLDVARERLRAVSGGLVGFLSGSEEAFLDTGSHLAGLERQARGLVDASNRAAALGSAAGSEDPARELDRELDRLERHLTMTREGAGRALQALSRVLAGAEVITAAGDDLENIPRTLRVLGMNTRIENSRAAAPNAGMESVAAEVRRLGDLVEPRFRAVIQQACSVRDTAAAGRATAEEFLRRDGSWSSQLLEETRSALEALRTLAASEGAVARRAVTASDQVAQSVGQILVGLQSHDATRQAIEHVVQELGALEDDARAAAGNGPLDPGGWLAEVSTLCELLAAQLRGARAQLVEALGQISGNLREIASQIDGLGAEAGRLAGEGGAGSPLEQVQRGVGQATADLRAHLEQERDAAAAMARVAQTVDGMAASVGEVRGLGNAVKIIALNALVETERVGDGARVLAVLAQGMGALAVEVAQRTGEMSQTLQEIAGVAGSLGGAPASRTASEGAAVAEELEGLVERLGTHHDALHAGVGALHQGGEALRREVEALAGRLDEQAGGAKAVRRLEEELERVGQEAARRAGAAGVDHAPVRSASASSRYTMRAEREIHRQVVQGGEAAADAAPAGGELGENVELF